MSEYRRIELAFSRDFGIYGSKEHYCHFLWGLALPGLYEAIKATKGTGERCEFVIEDCGPVMNTVLHDLFGLLQGEVVIAPRTELSGDAIFVPRWDILAHYQSVVGHDDYSENPHTLKFRDSPRLREAVSAPEFVETFTESVRFTRDWILEKIGRDASAPAKTDGKFLVLKRSDEPEYYSANGSAETKRYGTSRRTLTEIDNAVDVLITQGHPVTTYEPGAFPIADQVRTLMRCRGIIGIKGADFSNLAWMPKGGQMIVISPEKMNTPPIYQRLGKLLNLDYVEINGGDTSTPSLLKLVNRVGGVLNDFDRGR